MADKQLILVVEGTAAMGPYWSTIVSDYLDKIIRSFCANDMTTQKPSSIASGSTFELALVVFNTHGPYSASLVQRSGWTRDMDNFFSWLSSITFSGGGWNDVATAEGLAEALMMFAIPQNGYRSEQNLDGKRHCILVSASNPYPLPTPVYRPAIENVEQGENGEAQAENLLYDAETVSKWFGQCSVSLSVVCPKMLPKLKAIYNAGKRNQRAVDPAVDVKQAHFFVQISDSFMEALAALNRSGLAQNQSPATTLPPGSGPPNSMPPVNGSIMNKAPMSTGNVPQATVKIEPSTVTSMVSGPAIPHMPSVPRAAAQSVPSLQASSPPSVSQELTTTNENAPELKPINSNSMSQPLRPVGAILNNISQARVALSGGTSLGLPSMGGNAIGMHMSNMISNGMASNVPPSQTVLSSGQSGISALSGTGGIAGASHPVQNSALGSFSTATSNVSGNSNLGISQPLTNLQGNVSNTMGQTVSGIGQGNVSAMTQSGNGMNPNMISNLGSTGAPSGTGSMMPTPGMPQQVQPGMQLNNSAANMSMSQQAPSSLQSSQSKYVKVWEGNLSGQRQGQPVFITRLEGYRNATASETLAANWPPTMQIVRLISQDHMNNKQYVGKADFLVFRAMNQHGFLAQLQEKKLCAVIQLPSQTLLLSVSDKACRLIGMLFPGDMVVFKPQIPSQQQHQLQHQQLQHQQQQQNQQMQQQQNQQMQQQQQQPHSQLQPQQLQHLQQQQQQTMQQLQQQQQQLPQMQQPQLQHLPQQQQTMQQLQQQQQQMPQLQQQQIPQLQQQQQIPQLQQQQQIPQLQQQQQQQQLQQLQQQSQPQQMVGGGMGQGYMQGPGRPQLVPQGQVPSQGTQSNMSGGGFMG
ncbi:mediator of RNA polymerase II transcription subunit 25 isoform X2 [Spinacia oleracea]|uniref:Mediator of RNA polymerase II transcription subunit 25 n=1 Tax=Spinacia oleracea TaxID=3562 RepID=A0A9R0JWS9_SPIOL|nr:mediator of RNA polymerase II transcription subunit 25 isoform X2 [Spinacia oleracea]